jgi:hypothetical protein
MRFFPHLEHNRNGFCLACAFHHVRAIAMLLAPPILAALGFVEYEHVHQATIVVAPAVVSSSSSPWENWPCDLSARARAREAPDLADVCQS